MYLLHDIADFIHISTITVSFDKFYRGSGSNPYKLLQLAPIPSPLGEKAPQFVKTYAVVPDTVNAAVLVAEVRNRPLINTHYIVLHIPTSANALVSKSVIKTAIHTCPVSWLQEVTDVDAMWHTHSVFAKQKHS
jgi:hypothetical protein